MDSKKKSTPKKVNSNKSSACDEDFVVVFISQISKYIKVVKSFPHRFYLLDIGTVLPFLYSQNKSDIGTIWINNILYRCSYNLRRYRPSNIILYRGYRDKTWVPVTNIGTQKLVYICHRNEVQPSSCGIYGPIFEFLYLSQEQKFYP